MTTDILHTSKWDPDDAKPIQCSALSIGQSYRWISIEQFVSGDYDDHERFTYCKECVSKITPMDYLNAVEL